MTLLARIAVALLAASPLLTFGNAAAAAGPAQAVAPSPEALRLAELMSPRALMVEAEVQQFDLHFRPTLLKDPQVKELEAEYPGSVDAMRKAARALVGELTGARIDVLHPLLAQLLQSELTPAELVELTSFYGSSTGRKLVHQVVQNVDASQVYEQALQPNPKVDDRAAEAETWIAVMKSLNQFSEADQKALMAFGERPVSDKLERINAKVRKLTLDTMGAADPDGDKRMDAAMGAALEAHMASVTASASKD